MAKNNEQKQKKEKRNRDATFVVTSVGHMKKIKMVITLFTYW